MIKYYTKACNFYFGSISKEKIKKRQSIPLHGNNLISFDTVEILTRNKKRKINIQNINRLEKKIKRKILFDIKKISKKKNFQRIKIFKITCLNGYIKSYSK